MFIIEKFLLMKSDYIKLLFIFFGVFIGMGTINMGMMKLGKDVFIKGGREVFVDGKVNAKFKNEMMMKYVILPVLVIFISIIIFEFFLEEKQLQGKTETLNNYSFDFIHDSYELIENRTFEV